MSDTRRWQAIEPDPASSRGGTPGAPAGVAARPDADADAAGLDPVAGAGSPRVGAADSPVEVTAGGTHLRRTQARIVYLLLFIFAATVAAGFAGLAIGWSSENEMKDFLAMFVPAETALLGAATGFYFASQAAAETAEAVAAAERVRSQRARN